MTTARLTAPRKNIKNHQAIIEYRADIDGLRAIAVLSVVGFHAFPLSIKGGFIGVDVFFVISGFLISTIIFRSLERNSFSFVEFYSRRIRRIFPALALVLIASFVFGWFMLLAVEYKQLGKHIAGAAGFVSNFVLWNESGYFDNAADTKPLLHLWSLGIEEQYYIAWPLLLWLAWKKNFNLLTIAIAIAVISLTLNVGGVGNDKVAVFYSPQTRIWELLAGTILAYATLYKQTIFKKSGTDLDKWFNNIVYANAPQPNGNTRRNTQSVLGATLIVSGVVLITKESSFPGWWAVLPVAGAVLIISAGAQAWMNRAVLSNRVLVWFGLISFPLYLWHWPVLSFARFLGSETPSPDVRIAAILASIALAWLTYRLIEKPIRIGKHGEAKTIILIALMIVVGYGGYNCYQRDGLGFRLPKIVRELTQHKNEPDPGYRFGTCFLTATNEASAFRGCEMQTGKNSNKSILLWGDSYAAALYAGYKNAFGERYKIIQRTAGTCPPILNMEIESSPNCKKINDYIFEEILSEKPDKIVLMANWVAYDYKKLGNTIDQLHRIGISNIDLIGPSPQWIDGLPKQLYLYYKSDDLHRVPNRMKFGLNQNFLEIEPLMLKLAQTLKVNYISPVKILCNEAGCITKLSDGVDELLTWDLGHFTDGGSRFLVSKFPHN